MQVIFIIKQKDKWEYFLLILFQTCKHLMVDFLKIFFRHLIEVDFWFECDDFAFE